MASNLPSFEKAEYTAAPAAVASCARCHQPLRGRFFQMNGETLCEPCANAAVSSPAEGSDAAFARGILFGLGGAILGCILYAVIEVATGWTIGYVALAVGWLVGKGVKLGSEGRGGRRYQIAAVVLTYLSVSFAGLLVLLHAIQKQDPSIHFAATPRFAFFCAKYGLLSPFLDLQGNLIGGAIGLFILYIGLRTAWSLTAGSEFRITGPHTAEETGSLT